MILWLAIACVEVPVNPLAVDDDGDGYTEFDGDCDDSNASTFPGAAELDSESDCMRDEDADGYGDAQSTGTIVAGSDCEDDDPLLLSQANDLDCDGVLAVDDCDDEAPLLLSQANDMDCDGVLAVDDCDDSNPLAADTSNDADCDGVLTVDDCDDSDSSTVNDMDCDGVLAVDDCDDGDPDLLAQSNDLDCDGVLADDDCDDSDASTVNDMDCDGVLAVDDCDDSDPSTVDDMDCDGVLAVDDCDDSDPLFLSQANDMDCDGVLAVDDCDDTDSNLLAQFRDMDCDGVLAVVDCDDSDATQPTLDQDCDGIMDSCLAILTSGQSTGDGIYWIDPDGSGAFEAYCDMTTDGGGWMLIAVGGSSCSSHSCSIHTMSSQLTLSNNDTCSYLQHSRVAAMAQISTEVALRAGTGFGLWTTSARSTNTLAISALLTPTGNWHNGATWDNWDWSAPSCSGGLCNGGWPNMYHSGCNIAVHWNVGDGHCPYGLKNQNSTSTWLR